MPYPKLGEKELDILRNLLKSETEAYMSLFVESARFTLTLNGFKPLSGGYFIEQLEQAGCITASGPYRARIITNVPRKENDKL